MDRYYIVIPSRAERPSAGRSRGSGDIRFDRHSATLNVDITTSADNSQACWQRC